MKEINILENLQEFLKCQHFTHIYGINASVDESEILIHAVLEKYDYSLYRYINLWKK